MSTMPSVLQRFRQITVQYHELPAERLLGKEQLFGHLERLGFGLMADDDTPPRLGDRGVCPLLLKQPLRKT